MSSITKKESRSIPLASEVVSMITEKNSDVDNALLLTRVNQIIANTPKVASMNPEVIASAILKAMIPDPTLSNHDDIYFVPYGNKIDVSFSHNYLQKLAYKNGAVKVINTYLIYESDTVEITEQGLHYRIDPFRPQGDFMGVLVEVVLANGEKKYGTVTKEHIDKAREASKSKNNGPWKNWYYEMAKKVALKNTLKSINISSEFNDAVNIDNEDTVFSKGSTASSSEANTLESEMIESSKEINSSEDILREMGISFKVKGDWVMIDIHKSDVEAAEKIIGMVKTVKKKDIENAVFAKMSDITKALGDSNEF